MFILNHLIILLDLMEVVQISKSKVLARIKEYTLASYEKMNQEDFVLGELNYTYKCHLNSVQKVKEGLAAKVIACMAINKAEGYIIIHFINQLESGKYIDHTWGWINPKYDYYLIREIKPNEYDTIGTVFDSIRGMLVNGNSNWFDRKILRVKYDIL